MAKIYIVGDLPAGSMLRAEVDRYADHIRSAGREVEVLDGRDDHLVPIDDKTIGLIESLNTLSAA